jgi:uncharacterized protein (TIGR02145 family)
MKSITSKSKQLLAGWAAALALLSLNAPPAVAQTSDFDFSLKPLDVDAAIELTFTARGDATTVETVEVENLTRGVSVSLKGTDILVLKEPSSSVQTVENAIIYTEPKIYPNPAYDNGTMVFDTPQSGMVTITVTDLGGKLMTRADFIVEKGRHAAYIPAMPHGMYVVSVKGAGFNAASKWICLGYNAGTGMISLTDASNKTLNVNEKQLKNSFASVTTTADDSAPDRVEMDYEQGDLLRFTGKNGDMTTITYNQPTFSHDITFDLFECIDAAGNSYPIVRVGDYMWMAEDLKYVGSEVATLANSIDDWKNADKSKPVAAYHEYDAGNAEQGAYYNYAGARAALPSGWDLPLAGDVDGMVNDIGGYDVAGGWLKEMGDNSLWSTAASELDSISFGAQPYGYINENGESQDYGSSLRYFTRSTINNGYPVFFEIKEDNTLAMDKATAIPNHGYGFKVRGCRAAPTEYSKLMDMFNGGSSSTGGLKAAADSEEIFPYGPIGLNYVIPSEGEEVAAIDTEWHPGLNFARKTGESSFFISGHKLNSKLNKRKLMKIAAQEDATGRQSTIIAEWSREGWVDSPTDGVWNCFSGFLGNGTVKLTIVPSSGIAYNIKEVTVPGTFNMKLARTFRETCIDMNSSSDQEHINLNNWKTRRSPGLAAFFFYWNDLKLINQQLNVLCADFNDDGTPDIVVNVGPKIVILDGTDYQTVLYTKEWSTTTDCPIMRVAAGDVNNDGKTDLVVMKNFNYLLEVYWGGDLNSDPFTTSINHGDFSDIKVGDVTGDGAPDIVTFLHIPSRSWNDSSGGVNQAIYLRVLEWDGTNKNLKKAAFWYESSSPKWDDPKDFVTEWDYNSNVTLVQRNGFTQAADIIVGQSIYSYDPDSSTGFTRVGDLEGFESKSNDDERFDWGGECILPGNICAGNFTADPDAKQTYAYISHYCSDFFFDTSKQVFSVDVGGCTISSKLVVDGVKCSGQSDTGAGFFYISVDKRDGTYRVFHDDKLMDRAIEDPRAISPVRFSQPGMSLQYRSRTTAMSEPRIYAMLASPPYYKYTPNGEPYEYEYDMGTAWGKSEVSSTSSSSSSSHAASVIAGYEQEFTVPLWGTKIGGIELSVALESEWTNSSERTYTTTTMSSFQTKNTDNVVMQASFYHTYEYEVLAGPDPDQIGSSVFFSVPLQTMTMMITLDDYNLIAADSKNIPDLRKVFTHTVGYPFTYPSNKQELIDKAPSPSSVLWGAPFNGAEFVNTGSGGFLNRSITLDESTAETSEFSFSVDVDLVSTLYGVKAGAGYGYDNTNSTTHTEGTGHSVSGQVAGLRRLGESGLRDFFWNICWYKCTLGGQTFPVLEYVVRTTP